MNPWHTRFVALLLMLFAMSVHAWATESLPNTLLGMLMFHGSAALLDLFMLYSAPAILSGRLCTDTQKLLLASIIGNFAGWLLYITYVSPFFYNVFMWALTYVQLLRLFIPDHNVDSSGRDLVCRPDHLGGSLNN